MTRLIMFINTISLLFIMQTEWAQPTINVDPPTPNSISYTVTEKETAKLPPLSQPVTVRVGFYENPPKIYTDEDGTIVGFWPELISHIAAEEGWQIVWVPGTWEEGLARLEKNEIDIMPDVAWSESRSQIYAFSTQKVLISWSRLYTRPGIEINTVLDLEGKTVAGLIGSVNYDGAEGIKDITSRFDVNTTFIDMNNYTEVFVAIQNGIADAGVTNKDFGNQNESIYNVERTPFIFQPAHIEFAFPQDGVLTTFLLERVDAQIKQLKADDDSAYYQLLDTYLEQETAATIVAIIPPWVRILLLLGGGAIFFLLSVGITSRIQVRHRTAELHKSKDNYRNLFELATDGIFIANQAGQYIDVNKRGCEMLGYSRDELLTLQMSNLVVPEDLSTTPIRMEELLAGKAVISERILLRKDGSRLPVEISARLMPDGTLQGIARDITERRQSERERDFLVAQIREQASQLELILETVPTGVMLLDADGVILQANVPAEKGLSILSGAKIGDVLTGLGDKSLDELLTSPPGKSFWHEIKVERQVYEVISRPVVNGTVPGHWVIVIDDVTREREIRNQLQQQERIAAVGQLAAGIAHDFNNIMATIILYSQMLTRSQSLTAREKGQVETIYQQSWHASRLIEQILDFSRQAVLELHPLDLLPLLKEQIKLLQRTLPEHIEVELVHNEEPYIVNADPTRIQQIITNLAVNARDAMPMGGVLQITLSQIVIKPDESWPIPDIAPGDWVQLTMSDNGVGIAPGDVARIYEPFFTTKGPGGGSGLGLAQVYGIISQHGGFVTVESQLQMGTTFTIYLPQLNVSFDESIPVVNNNLHAGNGELILIVEDEHTLRSAIAATLKEWNYQVVEASNGQDALEKMAVQGEEIRLVLSDVIMPKMGGEALYYALKQKGWQVPVILLTGHPMDKKLDSLKADGLAAWLTKPPNLGRLAKIISSVLHPEEGNGR